MRDSASNRRFGAGRAKDRGLRVPDDRLAIIMPVQPGVGRQMARRTRKERTARTGERPERGRATGDA
jgi:hypothetical protein